MLRDAPLAEAYGIGSRHRGRPGNLWPRPLGRGRKKEGHGAAMLARDVVSSLRAPPVQRHRMVRGKPLRPSTQSETRPCRRALAGPGPRWMRKGRVEPKATPTGKRRRGRYSTTGRGGTSISCFSRQAAENTAVHETERCASISRASLPCASPGLTRGLELVLNHDRSGQTLTSPVVMRAIPRPRVRPGEAEACGV